MKNRLLPFILVLAFTFPTATISALEYIRFTHDGKERNEEGRIIVDASDGIAFESRDGRLYVIEPENIVTRRSDDAPFIPYTKAEMLERLKVEFPQDKGYYHLDLPPFIVVYTTSRPFANLYGGILVKLYTQYVSFWKRLGVELTAPEYPMVAIVLSNEERFRQYAKEEGVDIFQEQRAYYHKWTNRIVLYDMSGIETFREGNQSRATLADIRRFLAHPSAYDNVMTVVHEAVHQVGFNTGMHPRHTPNPVWLHEGLAVLHEVPDLRDSSGWTLGQPHINYPRLQQLRRYLGRQHMESPIIKMIQDDKLFSTPATALDNYALAWGVTYYLVKRRPKELAAYLRILQAKTPESEDNGTIRIKEFESCFGSDWNTFDKDFLNFIRRL